MLRSVRAGAGLSGMLLGGLLASLLGIGALGACQSSSAPRPPASAEKPSPAPAAKAGAPAANSAVASPQAAGPGQAAPGQAAAPKAAPAAPVQRWRSAKAWDQATPELCASRPQAKGLSVGWMTSPARPGPRSPLKLLVSVLRAETAPQVAIFGPNKQKVQVQGRVRSGIPAIADLDLGRLKPGRYSILIGQAGLLISCQSFVVRAKAKAPKRPKQIDKSAMWRATRSWTPAEEALYSAWILMLFDGPTQEDLGWRSMHEVTRDKSRNWLWNLRGWGEDNEDGLKLTPDCADTPYFLRAYFSWKRRLPFIFHRCNRGTASKAPTCRSSQHSQEPPIYRKEWLADPSAYKAYKAQIKSALNDGRAYPEFQGELRQKDPRKALEFFFSRTVGWGVHTGNGRVAWRDPKNDFYPVKLTRENLRPGTMYADPYGHILMLVDLHAGAPGEPGVLFAVDGQPDASITRKRFWQGNFLWNADPKLGGSGFKAFRPVVQGKDGVPRMLLDHEIAKRPGFAARAKGSELTKLSKQAFYDHMERLITPGVVDPSLAMRQLVDALAEAVRIRLRSVDNGVAWVREHPDTIIKIPEGYHLFETTGPWENYSTPARDLRLLIALDAVAGFPDKVGREPAAYGVAPEQAKAKVAKLRQELAAMLREPKYEVAYQNSGNEPVKLSLAEIAGRASALEMAYNPNDCPEIRWGASPKSQEAQSCIRRAPKAQRKLMQRYRVWFAERRRPARGERTP